MRVLLATNHYFDFTGSETFAYTMARALAGRGCDVSLYAPFTGGAIAYQTRSQGIPVFHDPKELTAANFDVIQASHNLVALEVRLHFPDVPLVFLSHGVLPFLEQPPVDDLNISRYLAVSEEVRENLVTRGVPEKQISIFRNGIDTERYQPQDDIRPKPERILVVSNRLNAELRKVLETVCRNENLELTFIGDKGRLEERPEEYMNRADVCVSLGRGILEAMSCGRAALVFGYNGLDGMVTAENIDEIQKCNFSGRRFKREITVESLASELKKYRQEMGAANRRLVLSRFAIGANVGTLLDEYEAAIRSYRRRELPLDRLRHYADCITESRNFSSLFVHRMLELNFRDGEAGQIEMRFREAGEMIDRLQAAAENSKIKIQALEKTIADKDARLEAQNRLLEEAQREKMRQEYETGVLLRSGGWKLLQAYYRMREKLLPLGSRRRKLFKLAGVFMGLKHDKTQQTGIVAGLKGIQRYLRRKSPDVPPPDAYAAWVRRNHLTPKQLAAQRAQRFKIMPLISVVMTDGGTAAPELLEHALHSLSEQTYSNWELCIAGREQRESRAACLANQTPNIKKKLHFIRTEAAEKPAAFVRACFAAARGDFILAWSPEDRLNPAALYEFVSAVNLWPDADFIYADEDALDAVDGKRHHPKFKPDWSPDLLESYNYIGGTGLIRKSTAESIFGPENDGNAFSYELWLAVSEQTQNIRRVPKILTHHSEGDLTVREAPDERVMSEEGKNVRRSVLAASPVKNTVGTGTKAVSLIVLNKDAPKYIVPLLKSLDSERLNRDYEVIVGDTGTSNREVLDCYRKMKNRIKVVTGLKYHFGRNYNQLAEKYAEGKCLGFLNNDIVVPDLSWIEKIEEGLAEPGVGVVGTKLLYPDGRLQHGGIYFMQNAPYRGLPFHRKHGQPDTLDPVVDKERVPAVTGAFLFCRRADFISWRGLDEHYREEAQDVDLCLKARRAGREILFMNLGGIVHVENGTRPKGSENPADREYFFWKWTSYLEAAILDSELNHV